MSPLIRFGVIGIIVLGGVGFLLSRVWQKPVPVEIKPPPAPEFSLKDYEGREVKLSDFRGKAVLVNAWAAWCPFCVDELPDFATIQEEFRDKLVVMAVNRAEPLETAKFFSDKVGVTGRLLLLLDPADSFYQAIGGFSMPETLFVDKNGFIRFHRRGPMKVEEIRRRVEEIL